MSKNRAINTAKYFFLFRFLALQHLLWLTFSRDTVLLVQNSCSAHLPPIAVEIVILSGDDSGCEGVEIFFVVILRIRQFPPPPHFSFGNQISSSTMEASVL